MDYTRNEDRICAKYADTVSRTYGLTIESMELATGAQEPVTLSEMKVYMNIDYDDWDALITELITAAREEAEKYCNLSFIRKNIEVSWMSSKGWQEVPYGPVDGDITAGGEVVEVKNKRILPQAGTVYTYLAGYTPASCPAVAKLAIKKMVSTAFEYRENEVEAGLHITTQGSEYYLDKISKNLWL